MKEAQHPNDIQLQHYYYLKKLYYPNTSTLPSYVKLTVPIIIIVAVS